MSGCVESGIAYFVAIVLAVRYMTVKKRVRMPDAGSFGYVPGS